MTLSAAVKSIKAAMYALFVYREPEPFSYVRDVGELTEFTTTEDLSAPEVIKYL